jgi:hypothetical protein
LRFQDWQVTIGQSNMKNLTILFLVFLLCAATLCGCAHRYVVTLDNGRRITAASKPKLKGERYVFKDINGKPGYVPAGRVREIAPASMVKDDKQMFNPQPTRK